MKKKRIKIMNVLIAIFLFVFFMLMLFNLISRLKKDFKVSIKELEINVGEDFKNNFTATYKGADVTENVKVETNLDNKVAGTYEIVYIYTKGDSVYKVKKNIFVIDNISPEITLKGGKDIVVMLDSEFIEPGYVALDNSDGDITDMVEVTGSVDTSKEGNYLVVYKVSDKSGNHAEVERKINVTKLSPLTMSVKDFSLAGLFEKVTLTKTIDGGQDYIENIIFAGDSMALYYVINEQISGKNLWHQISITPETALTSPIYINHQDTGKTFIENFEKYQPEIVIMTLGTNSAAYMSPEYFYEKYFELVSKIKQVSPNTKVIIQSIPPVDIRWDEKDGGINNDKINKLNYYIGKMCEELDIKFLNSAPVMKDENGACKKEYCRSDDGIHPTKEGQEVLIEFARTHMYEE